MNDRCVCVSEILMYIYIYLPGGMVGCGCVGLHLEELLNVLKDLFSSKCFS